MRCCGEGIKNIVSKSANIAIGYVKLAAHEKYEYPDKRVRICQQCEWNTWMKFSEFIKWLKEQGIIILTHLHELEKLPLLPKQELSKDRRNLFCRKCKCFIPAKAKVKKEKCPEGKW